MTLKIKLNSAEDAKKFCRAAEDLYGEVDVKSDRYVVDGKSLLGLLSLDLSKTLTVDIIDDENSKSVSAFKEEIKALIVK